jgi:hypothetical protein|nr:MAG TPA: hypothetical protein [Bacteriophage sp.]
MQFLSTPVGSVARVCFERFLDEKSLSVKVLINKEDFGFVGEFLAG